MGRILAAVLAAVVLAGCGTASAGTAAPQTHAAVAASDNAQVCRNYLKQRAWVKGLVQPTIADAVQFKGDVQVDWQNTEPGSQLSKDLGAMWGDMNNFSAAEYAASTRVYDDCT